MLAASFDDKTSALDACKSGSLMHNDEIAEILDEIADMLELRDDNFYHKRAYRLAAEGVRDFPQPIELLPHDQLQKIRGIGPNLASKLATLLETGEQLREARGEFEAAEHRLPALLELADLRGDLHTHSTWTDGRASIEQMARSVEKHRLEYFALTDHSQRLKMVNGLDPARLRDQWREIDSVRERVPGVKLLRGIEVDILEDGELDLPQDVLAELDWVVASVHSKLDQEPAAMTERLLRAIRNPMVDVIGHPTGRLIGRRNPSNFDLDAVLRAASQEGCALEVNSQVDRLDLRDEFCREAKRAGLKLVISTDAHRHAGFSLLVNGVNQARQGWIEANDVLNTRPLAKLRQRRSIRE
jgi:DNA polymerase (family X)